MAMRNFLNGGKIFSMHAKPILTTCTIQIGASGAVSSFVGSTVASVTRLGTGLYKITLQANSQAPRVISAHGSMQSPASGLSGISQIEIQNNPNSTVSAASSNITIKTLDAAGSLADPASGSAINFMMITNDSTIIIGGE